MPLLLTLAITPSLHTAIVAWLAAGGVSWAAHRAAIASTRLGYEAPEAHEDPAPVWRALMVGAIFCSLQGISDRLQTWPGITHGYGFAVSIALGAGWLLSASRVADRRPVLWKPQRKGLWLLGVLLGAVSGASAWLLHPAPSSASTATLPASVTEWWVLWAAVGVVGPIAEERFFRGWLQHAVARELPARRRHLAFVPSALIFTLFHVNADGPPQLLLGLFAGALFAYGRALGPGVVAHCVHNSLILFVAAQYSSP